jgi:hypothetical protein
MGILLVIVALAMVGFGVMNHLKGKRVLAAPFKKTGELAQNPTSPDPKGAISTEGKVLPPAQALLSPCTKNPCLYYEVKVERLWEKTETTQDGTKTVKGSDTLSTVKGGAVFGLDDGSGPVTIDFSKGADFDNFKPGYKKELNGRSWASNIEFGELKYDVPVISDSEKYTIGFKATEKFVPVEGSLFVLGKIEGGRIVKPGWRSLMTSAKGREGLLGSVTKRKKMGFITGGVAAVLSIPAFIFAPASDPNAPSATCESQLKDSRAKCSATLTSKTGDDYTWTVTKAGEYELTVFAPAKKIAFDPKLIVTNDKGEVVAEQEGGTGSNAIVKVQAQPGTYKMEVKTGDDYMVKGGFSYDMEIRDLSAPTQPAAAGAAAAADKPAEPVAKADEPAPAAAAPEAGPTAVCSKAARCCKIASGKNSAACETLLKAPDATCEASLPGFKKAVKAVKPKMVNECS